MSKQENVISHRTLVFEGFTTTVSNFYALIEQAIASRAIPGARASRVFLSEGGFWGAKREYLRIRRRRQEFLISASAFGSQGFMVTWWLRKVRIRWLRWVVGFVLVCSFLDTVSERLYFAVTNFLGCLLVPVVCIAVLVYFIRKVPGVGLLFKVFRSVLGWGVRAVRTPTLHALDSTAAFHSEVPAVVERVIETLRSAQGLRSIGSGALRELPPAAGL